MVGAEKRSLLLLLRSSALADPGCFADFTVGSEGLERPSLQFAVQRPVLYSVHSTLSPQCTVTVKNKNGHTLISIFKLEQSLRTERNWVIVKKVVSLGVECAHRVCIMGPGANFQLFPWFIPVL